jgi:uncharacterized ferritin-like protein (DUF455 family)
MDFFRTLHPILTIQKPSEKIDAFRSFYVEYKNSTVIFDRSFTPEYFDKPAYEGYCTIVPPKQVPRRKNVALPEGQSVLLHAIAHIEYSAIDLALDHAYRFPGLPKQYYDDWLEVADDEVRHFEMIHSLLDELQSGYGDFPVHNGLFEASRQTQTLLERMAVVPRYFEASGLDATPEIIARLKRLPADAMVEKIIALLNVIVEEEVDHVLKGDRWFEYACEQDGVEKSVYFDIIERFYPGSFPKQKSLNVEGRREAGFSCSELNRMSIDKVC